MAPDPALVNPWDTGAPNSSLSCIPGVEGMGEILLPRLDPLNAAAALTAIMLAVDVLILLGLTLWPAASGGGGGTMPPKPGSFMLDAVDPLEPKLGVAVPWPCIWDGLVPGSSVRCAYTFGCSPRML